MATDRYKVLVHPAGARHGGFIVHEGRSLDNAMKAYEVAKASAMGLEATCLVSVEGNNLPIDSVTYRNGMRV